MSKFMGMDSFDTNQTPDIKPCTRCHGDGFEPNTVFECNACHGTGTVPIEPKNPAESEVSEELLSESITSIPPQPAPEPSCPRCGKDQTKEVNFDCYTGRCLQGEPAPDSPDDELEQILKHVAYSPLPDGQTTYPEMIAEAHDAIEAWASARFERAIGVEPSFEDRTQASSDWDTNIAGRVQLRAEARTRWQKGDGIE